MKKNNTSQRKPYLSQKSAIAASILVAVTIMFVTLWLPVLNRPEPISLSEVAAAVVDGRVSSIEDVLSSGEIIVQYIDGTQAEALRDTRTSLLEQLSLLGVSGEQLAAVEVEVVASGFPPILKVLLVSIALAGIPLYAAYRMTKTGAIGRKDFREVEIPDLHFEDVAGLDENLQELRDIVAFLKEKEKYTNMGAKMPRGVLMVGDPGTGKTLMAKAIAGEAGVPFFAMSGSEFVEMFVGVGASRVRSLFKKAKKKAPCIIFIDEIDAVGRERIKSGSGAEAEQDQTLNQLLVEMDGFSSEDGIVVLAATNRSDILDPALTRAGRFDRRLFVNRPDVKGREGILHIHMGGMKLAADVKLADVARATPGLVGADLANIVNEAAIGAVRDGRAEIQMRDFEEAIEKSLAGGVARKNQVMSQDERSIVAYHEAGHAVVMHETHLSDPVYKVTIIPRGMTAGYTMALPEQDSLLISRSKILARITGLLGGRAAEELFFQDITSGASNDLDVATQLAEEMVMRLGMDKRAGLRVYPQSGSQGALGALRSSQKTFEALDEAVNTILEGCYAEAKRILLEKRPAVDRIAAQLLEVETLNRDQFVNLMQ